MFIHFLFVQKEKKSKYFKINRSTKKFIYFEMNL